MQVLLQRVSGRGYFPVPRVRTSPGTRDFNGSAATEWGDDDDKNGPVVLKFSESFHILYLL